MKKYGLIILSVIFIVTLFAQKTLNIFKTDLSVINVIVNSVDSLKFSNNDTILEIHNTDNTVTSIPVSSVDSLTFTNNVSKNLPVVTTSAVTMISYTTALCG